ncbi:MAG TPA: ABC transporter ATP-binding protein [Solirubrobacteraceae bacterium]|jgi:multiple sugar transport system ATP-binding protein|nr:ABC transporter ATP-binding protein [Solirubrobacteraceae bacterium]
MSGFSGGVRFEEVWKLFGEDNAAVANLNLHIREGEFLVLVGPSGCGKTTSLRMLAGLERPTFGRIWFGERDVTTLSPGERDVAMVFQSYALYPNMTVYRNLAFGPTVRGESKKDLRTRVDEVAEVLGIGALLSRRPNELSGGQRQRVALGRALLRDSRLFLLDEPLSNLDAALRVQMRAELIRLHKRLTMTTSVYVTHDQIEALTMGDRVAVLKDGDVMQCATPSGLYENPANSFVAGFIGSPKMNLLSGEFQDGERRPTLTLLGGEVELHPLQAKALRDSGGGRTPLVGIRPADLRPPADVAGTSHTARLQGIVDVVEHSGSEIFVTVRVHDQLMVARFPRTIIPTAGDHVELVFNPSHLYFFAADSGERLIDREAVLRDLGEAPDTGALSLNEAQH